MPYSRTGLFRFIGPTLGLAVAGAFSPVLAQDAPRPEESFAEVIDVELIDLEAVVTDSDGNRVHGLGREAFRVLVDGEEAAIELFDEVRAPIAAEDGSASGETAERPPVNYLVFIDDLMTLERNRDFVLSRLRSDLDLMEEGDRMAIVRLGAHRKLQRISDWTSDRGELESALDRAMELDAWGIKYIALRRMPDFIANWEGNDTRRSVLAAAGSMRLLAPPEGRRALLLVAGSWDPVEARRADRFAPWCITGWCQGSGVFNVLTDTANLLGYSIYAIDVEGTDTDFNWNREKRLHGMLGELAKATGGRRLLNGERGRMLATAVEDTRSYYAIAVAPPPGRADRRLSIEIEMVPDGLEVRAQTAAVPLSPERDRQLGVLNALWREEGSDEGIELRLGHPHRLGGGKVAVTAHLRIAADKLDWRNGSGEPTATFTVRVTTLDWRGDSTPVVSRHFRLRRSEGATGDLVVPWPLELRRRRHTIVAAVEGAVAGGPLTAVAEIAPRDPPARDGSIQARRR